MTKNQFFNTGILILLIGIILFFHPVNAGNENTLTGAKAVAMGGCSVSSNDFWSVNNNQAGIANFKNIKAGFYIENRYLLKNLTFKALAIILPTKSGVFGVNYSHFGNNLYNEQKIGLAYAKTLGKKISAGLQFDYLNTSIGDNYGNKNNFTFEIGIHAGITEKITLGIHLFNPLNTTLNEYNNEKIPSVFKFGLNYQFSDDIILALETEKNINFKPVIKAGLEYKILTLAYARIGVSDNPDLFSFGFGITQKQFTFDFSSTYHQTLGYSPQLSLIYTFN